MAKNNRPTDKTPWGRAIPYTSPTGKETTLYNIGVLAEAIGRTPSTVRKWEVSGVIPPTPFKTVNRRLYSTEHIDALVRCVEKYHVTMGVQLPVAFSKAVYREFQKINDYFFKEENENGIEECNKD